MPTWNKELHALTKEQVNEISLKFLMGWTDLIGAGYSFRLQGFNHMREKYGMEPLTREMSFRYRIQYVRSHYSTDEIRSQIIEYLKQARVGDTRWTGIELFGCRFGREYAKAFKELLGPHDYRELSEVLRNMKSIETQNVLYGGIGLAGQATKEKAFATNQERYGGNNVMCSKTVRNKVAATNMEKYGGISPFCSKEVRYKALSKISPELVKQMKIYKTAGKCDDIHCESTWEFQAFKKLIARYGSANVICQYGIHPSDPRYPHNCDFYIRSEDLFIELNLHYVHGLHWFDPDDQKDVQRRQKLEEKPNVLRNRNILKVWCGSDIVKRKDAKKSGIKYLVFWGGCKKGVYDLYDFYRWFYEYDCDYNAFVKDYPCCTC